MRTMLMAALSAAFAILAAASTAAAQTAGTDVLNPGATRQPPATNPTVSAPQSPEAALAGDYNVNGVNPNGSQYRGTVKITVDGKDVHLSWKISNGDAYQGKGRLKGNVLTVNWGARHPVIYKVGADRFLRGTWDAGRAKEDLVPFN